MDGGELPTRQEWIDEQSKKNDSKPVSKFDSNNSKASILQGRK